MARRNGEPDRGRGKMLGALWRTDALPVGGAVEYSDPTLPVIDPVVGSLWSEVDYVGPAPRPATLCRDVPRRRPLLRRVALVRRELARPKLERRGAGFLRSGSEDVPVRHPVAKLHLRIPGAASGGGVSFDESAARDPAAHPVVAAANLVAPTVSRRSRPTSISRNTSPFSG